MAGSASIAALICCLCVSAEAKGPQKRYAPGEFHGYFISVSDRAGREVTISARGKPDELMRSLAGPGVLLPYSVYGVQGSAGEYKFGVVRYSREDTAGCAWSTDPDMKSSLDRCTEAQVKGYSAMLEHAVGDVAR